MKPIFIIAALMLLPGCDDFSVPNINSYFPDMAQLDECTTAPAGRSCLTLHLTGDVGPIDSVQIDAIFQLGTAQVARRVVSSISPMAAVAPPIAVGVILDQDSGEDVEVKVLALDGTMPVAVSDDYESGVRPGDHVQLDMSLTPADKTLCFDHIKDGDESDVDCGWSGACPLCTVGNTCQVAQDCANSSCIFNEDTLVSSCQ